MSSVQTRSRSRQPPASFDVSIVVPAYKEAENLPELTRRVFAALDAVDRAASTELIIVDDNSNDGSEEAVVALQATFPNVRIIVRRYERGLSSAVLRGFAEAQGRLLLCMDADLQHPPEALPSMIAAIDATDAEFVIGTRYGSGELAVDKDWPLYRQVVSAGARLLARPLTPLTDPMTGFFGLPRSVYDRATQVNSIGFKIAMELFVKCRVQRHAEVPIHFGVRVFGQSKLTGKVIVHYLRHLAALYRFKHPFVLFLALFVVFICIAASVAFIAGAI